MSMSSIVPAIQAELKADATVLSLVGTSDNIPFILQCSPQGLIEGTESGAVVIAIKGSWRSGSPLHPERFPKIEIEVWMDPVRDASGVATESFPEVTGRALDLWEAVDNLLHRNDGEDVMFGTLKIGGSDRLVEPTFIEVPDGTGLVIGKALYGLTF